MLAVDSADYSRALTVAELMNKSDRDLFCKLCATTHALNHYLHLLGTVSV